MANVVEDCRTRRPSEVTDTDKVWARNPAQVNVENRGGNSDQKNAQNVVKEIPTTEESKDSTGEAECDSQNNLQREGLMKENGSTSRGMKPGDAGEKKDAEDGMRRDENKMGKWLIFLNRQSRDYNGDTLLDRIWKKVVRDLVNTGVVHKASCSTGVDQNGVLETQAEGVIRCYTTDYTDIEDVKRVAECIWKLFSKFEKPRCIAYKTDKAKQEGRYRATGCKDVSLYKYTGKALSKKHKGNWLIIDSTTVVEDDTDHVEEGANQPEGDYEWSWKSFDDLKPGFDRDILGTWVLHLDLKTEFDSVRRELEKLAERGELYNVAGFTSSPTGKRFIHCFTHDHKDTADVKRAADAIRRVVHIDRPIFYKKDFLTLRGKDAWKGDFRISCYLHTQDGRLMVRHGAWKPSIPETVALPTGRPSEIQSAVIIPAREYRIPDDETGKWTVFLDRVKRDENGTTELDRAWVGVKELVNRRILLDAVCTTAADNPYNLRPDEGAIFCYADELKEINYVVKTDHRLVDIIRDVVQPSTDMFYDRVTTTRVEDLKAWKFEDAATYKLTVDLEIYEKTEGQWEPLDIGRPLSEADRLKLYQDELFILEFEKNISTRRPNIKKKKEKRKNFRWNIDKAPSEQPFFLHTVSFGDMEAVFFSFPMKKLIRPCEF